MHCGTEPLAALQRHLFPHADGDQSRDRGVHPLGTGYLTRKVQRSSPGPTGAEVAGPRLVGSCVVVAGGVAAPGCAGVGDLAGSALLVEAERVRDNGRGRLQDQLAYRGDAGVDEREAELAHAARESAVADGLPGELARKQPSVFVGLCCWGELAQQVGERVRDGGGWVAEPDQ